MITARGREKQDADREWGREDELVLNIRRKKASPGRWPARICRENKDDVHGASETGPLDKEANEAGDESENWEDV